MALGQISVRLGADISGLTEGLAKASDEIKRSTSGMAGQIANGFGRVGGAFNDLGATMTKSITLPIVAATAAITAAAVKTGQYADRLLDLQQITGMSTNTLQEFEHVSRAAGVSFEGLVGASSKLQARLVGVENDSGAAADALKRLGVSVHGSDGALRSMNDLFPEIISRLQGMSNVTERNMLATAIFGRSLNDVAPVLGMASAEVERLRKEAHALGLVMSEEALGDANAFRQELEILQKQFAMVGMAIAQQFMPILKDTVMPMLRESLIPALKQVIESLAGVAEWFKNLSPSMQQTVLTIGAVVVAGGPLLQFMGGLFMAIKGLITSFTVLRTVFGIIQGAMLTTTAGAGGLAGAFTALWAAVTGPVGIVIAAITAVIAIGYLLIKNWDTVKHYALQAWGAIKQGILTAVRGVVWALSKLPGMGDKMAGALAKIDGMIAKEREARADRASARAIEQEEKRAKAQVKAAADGYKAGMAGVGAGAGVELPGVTVAAAGATGAAAPSSGTTARLSAMESLAQDIAHAERKARALGDEEEGLAEKISAHRQALDRLITEGAADNLVNAVASELKALEARQRAIREGAKSEQAAIRQTADVRQRATTAAVTGYEDIRKAQEEALNLAEAREMDNANAFLSFNSKTVEALKRGFAAAREALAGVSKTIGGTMTGAPALATAGLSMPSTATIPNVSRISDAAGAAGPTEIHIHGDAAKLMDWTVKTADGRARIVVDKLARVAGYSV